MFRFLKKTKGLSDPIRDIVVHTRSMHVIGTPRKNLVQIDQTNRSDALMTTTQSDRVVYVGGLCRFEVAIIFILTLKYTE